MLQLLYGINGTAITIYISKELGKHELNISVFD